MVRPPPTANMWLVLVNEKRLGTPLGNSEQFCDQKKAEAKNCNSAVEEVKFLPHYFKSRHGKIIMDEKCNYTLGDVFSSIQALYSVFLSSFCRRVWLAISVFFFLWSTNLFYPVKPTFNCSYIHKCVYPKPDRPYSYMYCTVCTVFLYCKI